MRLIKDLLLAENQLIVALENGKPCPHCYNRQDITFAQHAKLWTVPRALVLLTGGEETVICLDCLDEKRK